jgi:hypothetical protein
MTGSFSEAHMRKNESKTQIGRRDLLRRIGWSRVRVRNLRYPRQHYDGCEEAGGSHEIQFAGVHR